MDCIFDPPDESRDDPPTALGIYHFLTHQSALDWMYTTNEVNLNVLPLRDEDQRRQRQTPEWIEAYDRAAADLAAAEKLVEWARDEALGYAFPNNPPARSSTSVMQHAAACQKCGCLKERSRRTGCACGCHV